MASPPFEVEDQTDEDFFDKLVNDDDDGITSSSFKKTILVGSSQDMTEVLDANDTESELPDKAFSKLSLEDMGTSGETHEDLRDCVDKAPDDPVKDVLVAEESVSLRSFDSFVFNTVVERSDSVTPLLGFDINGSAIPKVAPHLGFEVNGGLDPNATPYSRRETIGGVDHNKSESRRGSDVTQTCVKEVQWSSFYAVSTQTDAGGFGSYSDFYSELEGDLADPNGGSGNSNIPAYFEPKNDPTLNRNQAPVTTFSSTTYQDDPASMSKAQSSFYRNNPVTFVSSTELRQEGTKTEEDGWNSSGNSNDQSYGVNTSNTTDGWQDVYSIQHYESLYPGWKYDWTNKMWYQVDSHYESASSSFAAKTLNQEGCIGQVYPSTGDGASISNQGSMNSSVTSFSNQSSESVVGTNNPSQGGSGYPSHMYFDPQCPGWYFDMLANEWRSLDSYVQTTQSDTTQGDPKSGNQQAQDAKGSLINPIATEAPVIAAKTLNQESCIRQGYPSAGDGASISNQGSMNSSGMPLLNQSSESVVGTNNPSQGDSGYPNHMYFDPQCPGWYFDMLTNEWRSLDSYVQTTQSDTTQIDPKSGNQQAQDANVSLINAIATEAPVISEHGQTDGWTGYLSSHSHAKDQVHTSFPQQNVSYPGQTSTGQCGDSQYLGQSNLYNSAWHDRSHGEQQMGFGNTATVPSYVPANYSHTNAKSQNFVTAETAYQFENMMADQQLQTQVSSDFYGNQKAVDYSPPSIPNVSSNYTQFSYGMAGGRTTTGRPHHALVTFAFGGKLVVMKPNNSFSSSAAIGSQDPAGGSISIINLMDIVVDKNDIMKDGSGASSYFHALCQQSFPGPLVGGSASSRDVYKLIDERIANCAVSSADFREGGHLRLLLSLLKICCQHYGKLRSPFAADSATQEVDGPESAVTKLFASTRNTGLHMSEYGACTQCLQSLPSEAQSRATAIEMQNLLIAGRKKEALQCGQEGQLWGPALVLAQQLGEEASLNGMLDDWKENVAIIAGNRIQGDQSVLVHLGDCLWRERDEVIAAQACYLVAELNIEPFSDTARLCLIGADHLKCPRTYASPEAIQRTEVYEYTKVQGNAQYILLPFQPYKVIYAHMLAEVGKVSDSLRYCQALSKSMKNAVRAPEAELWKSMISSLEERIRTHQQGGYSSNLAPAKLVGKLFTTIDRSIHRMIGAPPPPLPPLPGNALSSEPDNHLGISNVVNNSSRMSSGSLMPSASMDPISEWTGDNNKFTVQSRSISEPDFGSSLIQKDAASQKHSESKALASGGGNRFGRFGSSILQKAVGLVSRNRQAKLGEKNKFYYDEKLKRWVEEGAEPPPAEAVLAPPPTMASFQNGTPDYNPNSTVDKEVSPSNGVQGIKSPIPSGHTSGMPPIPPSTNQFSSRGRMGVRSRYVDTFNKGGGTSQSPSFQSPAAQIAKKPSTPSKFFVPTQATPSESIIQNDAGTTSENMIGTNGEDPSISGMHTSLPPIPSSSSMPRFASLDNVTSISSKGTMGLGKEMESLNSLSRAASWSGGFPQMIGHKPLNLAGGPSLSSSHSNSSLMNAVDTAYFPNSSGSFSDLQEVEL
ncbi:hypothetical protein AMTR_s00019p00148170 [Amborella trichopoda]|uniref:Protein transport protein sec16 n=1 Tax=Amborella trichopoda TaxID=13333 RepID=W1PGU0_AMBTC|nr:hypothetical protein AMTR_s00019p00148170 [Amborella trichopoda]